MANHHCGQPVEKTSNCSFMPPLRHCSCCLPERDFKNHLLFFLFHVSVKNNIQKLGSPPSISQETFPLGDASPFLSVIQLLDHSTNDFTTTTSITGHGTVLSENEETAPQEGIQMCIVSGFHNNCNPTEMCFWLTCTLASLFYCRAERQLMSYCSLSRCRNTLHKTAIIKH